jgi:hypothetical protein
MPGQTCALAALMSLAVTRLRYHSSMISGRRSSAMSSSVSACRRAAAAARSASSVSASDERRAGRQSTSAPSARNGPTRGPGGAGSAGSPRRAARAGRRAPAAPAAGPAPRPARERSSALFTRASRSSTSSDQALRAERPPVGVAHVLQHVLHDLAPALLGHQVSGRPSAARGSTRRRSPARSTTASGWPGDRNAPARSTAQADGAVDAGRRRCLQRAAAGVVVAVT